MSTDDRLTMALYAHEQWEKSRLRCPRCQSTNIENTVPLYHRCLSCGAFGWPQFGNFGVRIFKVLTEEEGRTLRAKQEVYESLTRTIEAAQNRKQALWIEMVNMTRSAS